MEDPGQRPPRRPSDDPDATAELPRVDEPVHADAADWAPPPVQGTLVDELLQAHEQEIHLLRRELAATAQERAQLRARRDEAEAGEEQQRQQLAAAEARADELARQMNELERAVEERDVRIAELQLELEDAGHAPSAGVPPATTGVVAALAVPAPAAAAATAATTAATAATAAGTAPASPEGAQWRALQEELAQLRWRVAAQGEALQGRESRRQVWEGEWRELEARAAEAGEQLAARERQLAARDVLIEALRAELATAQAAARIAMALPVAGATPAPGEPLAGEQDGATRPGPLRGEAWPAPAGAVAPGAVAPGAVDPVSANDTGAFAATGDFQSVGLAAAAAAEAPGEPGPDCLLVRTDGGPGAVHALGRRTTIGRTPDNDLRIPADWVSRHHAVILRTPAGIIIEDLNSTNGVVVNGERVTRRRLADGDLLMIGKTGFRFECRGGQG